MPPPQDSIFPYILSIFQFIGILINVLQILILLQKDLRCNPTYRLMTWICLFDILSQISTFTAYSPLWIRNILENELCFVSKSYQDTISNLLGSAFSDTFQRLSIWLALVICFYDAMKISKPNDVFKVISLLCLMSVIWSYMVYFQNVIQPVYFELDCTGINVTFSETRYQVVIALPKHKVLYGRILILDGIVKIVPTVMECALMMVLLKNEKARCTDERTKRENVTKLILVFMIPYLLTGVPSTFATCLKALLPDDSLVL
ncbi:hypothetical protein L5515_006829 [Caenorhabditis briggsae]|uniref:G-protein coupled receptors family 1 profile domain-containing protein n=1 Tax=Caenorhabditis briggsae TaxID=6238 RepID=A0AAE9EWW4_CAEBR|nr:hypothetical protein L5515_006829 [Caenorhabditis briggsae]